TDFEACVAAHYVARHQPTLELTLHWNAEALRRADAAGRDRVRELYPSLYLNLAHSLEHLGRMADAREHYDNAARSLAELPATGYGMFGREADAEGRMRVVALPGVRGRS